MKALGTITTEFTVWCGECSAWYQVQAPSKRYAIKLFKETKWKKTREHGWLCSVCQKKVGKMTTDRSRGVT